MSELFTGHTMSDMKTAEGMYAECARLLAQRDDLKAQNESCRKALERISRAACSDEAKHRTDTESLAYAVIQARCALSILEPAVTCHLCGSSHRDASGNYIPQCYPSL